MLTTNQQQRNPTARERQVLAALASGASRQEAAALTGLSPRAVAAILERLRDRYAPTLPALIAIAVKLEWIPVPIWTMHTDPTPRPPTCLNRSAEVSKNLTQKKHPRCPKT